jgi:hypothetical protein
MVVAGTPEYPDRAIQPYNYNHFAPRVGLAYRVNDKTTIRASANVMYISSTGGYYSMWTTVVPSTSAIGGWDSRDASGRPLFTWDDMFTDANYSYYKHTVEEANYQVGGNIGGPVYSTKSDMPREYQWSFTLQRQLSPNMVVEAAYAGNHSNTLLVTDLLNPFQGQYLKPELADLLSADIANPIAGQLMASDTDYTGETVPLGVLLTSNPSRGYLRVNGNNLGRSMYNGLNLRFERRMSGGFAALVNYTFSKSLDNVGGPNQSPWGAGSFQKSSQITETFRNAYGYSPIDRTHRLVWYHDVELPFGKGRRFLNDTGSTGGKVLDYIIGGWELAGDALFTTGTPITFGSNAGNVSQDQGAPGLFGFIKSGTDQITNSGFGGGESVLRSPNDSYQSCQGRFDCAQFAHPQMLTAGNLSYIYPWVRNPSFFNYDASLMKNFFITEGVRLQLRVEAENVFNVRGLGNYNTTFGDPYFGYITAAGNTPRTMQISGRIFF